ncbi:hypothetical protein LTR10_020900 [Elasticomyces elasticus]|uniref:Cytochrome P450 monooxygenase n=1 Tax=Exophiala sideris TaxID=1016849 RepID=A0ABR0IZL6_9EURO|nr:hypothetical protein LTR10_020900 [Elasticomyces elasticus]KAK5023387.1 hypothetical protein LTS07_009262 [Exophiala sideris]KAK5028237.1 hypothetical protein LTR13_009225 [Exophiala sideris]KAK5052895.1 hypothetical protein LTR69_009721 [Exophiala sideris]KAK5178506.1 hypothetical protein LTR44_009131 [Eurotiomycetes sp. CCFEE 6388]
MNSIILSSVAGVVVSLGMLTAAYTISIMVYNVYFHPLSSYPGPRIAASTVLWYMYSLGSGQHHRHCIVLHKKYGKVVRVGPNKLSFISPEAYKEIYGHRPGKSEMPKDQVYYGTLAKENLIVSNNADHARIRRLLAHAFSDRSLREQEDIMKQYVDLFMTRIAPVAQIGKSLDMVSWYNFTTFDIIGDLAFGEAFGSLEKSALHPWIQMIFEGIKAGTWLRCARYWPLLSKLLSWLIPKELIRKRDDHQALATQKVQKRLQQNVDRKDFTSYILRHNDEKGMSVREIEVNANLLIIAGSETTATLLSGATYYLSLNPRALKKATDEVRLTFQSEDEITIDRAGRLSYLMAVVEESFRLYPPVPTGLPRVVPAGGEVIDGKFVPGGTAVAISQLAAYHSPSNFRRPEEFIPERWIEGSKFPEDQLAVVQPFSMGPRNCLGKKQVVSVLRDLITREPG